MIYSSDILGLSLAWAAMRMQSGKLPKRKRWRRTSAPHDYPPSPYESRQVRRARLRRDAATLARTEDGGRNDG